MKSPVRVAVTGAAGQIGYALLFRIASGQMFGADQPVILQLLEMPLAMKVLEGVVMEVDDCAFPLMVDYVLSDQAEVAFKECDYALLVGARPRTAGMERSDLLAANGSIFKLQGTALNGHAARHVKVVVVGNPANTNAYTAMISAPDLEPRNFTALMRLDHNRALAQLAQLAQKTNTLVPQIKKMVVWGNHSLTQYPDIRYCMVDGKPASELITKEWYQNDYIPKVAKRGGEIIAARGASSAASAANAVVDHIHDWVLGTPPDDWTSMAVRSDGSYGIPEGLIYSFPVVCENGDYKIVQDLDIDDYSQSKMALTQKELEEERDAIAKMI